MLLWWSTDRELNSLNVAKLSLLFILMNRNAMHYLGYYIKNIYFTIIVIFMYAFYFHFPFYFLLLFIYF